MGDPNTGIPEQRRWRQFAETINPGPRHLVILLLVLASSWWILSQAVPSPRNYGWIALETVVFPVLLLLGMVSAGYRGRMDDNVLSRMSTVDERALKFIYNASDNLENAPVVNCRGDLFVLVISSVLGIYIIGYIFVLVQLGSASAGAYKTELAALIDSHLDKVHFAAAIAALEEVSLKDYILQAISILITCAAIFSLSFASAQYAGYIRLISLLDVLCVALVDSPSEKSSEYFATITAADINKLRRATFKLETLHEPPGNIFVMIGITGTFLGLAIGLATLPLIDMINAHDTTKSLTLGLPFVRSMGLALGVSTTGVISAIAAHWLRAYAGPAATTEELLSRSKELVQLKTATPTKTPEAAIIPPQGAIDIPGPIHVGA